MGSASDHSDVINNLLNVKKFFQYTYEEKINLKAKGRPLPDIFLEVQGSSRGKVYKRQFNRDIYTRNKWICGCNRKNALFCFPCVLFNGDKSWAVVGITDLVHLSEKIKKHENSKQHLHNEMELALLGTANIREQLDSAYWINIRKQNEYVTKNRYVLAKIIDCILFCGAFELALRGHDESESSENIGIFRELVNFSAALDATLSEHLKNATVFKGTSKEIQNDLLDCMLEVCHEEIKQEIKKSSCVAIIADETTDISAVTQLVIVFRYTLDGEAIERFWNYVNIVKCDAESISTNIFNVIDPLLEETPNKLIAQSYDGAAVMSGQHSGVQVRIKEKYKFAHFIHCYAHQLNLIMAKAASFNSKVRIFFGNLHDIPGFFNNSPQRVEVLNRIVKRKIPQGATTRWNFNIRTVNVVFENLDSLIECMEEIEENFAHSKTSSSASSIRRMLQDSVFIFWLTFFHHVMPHVNVLYNQLQKRTIEPTEVQGAIEHFQVAIVNIRNKVDEIISEASGICYEVPERKRKRSNITDHRMSALEICDVIINCAKDRFAFKDHLVAASLLSPNLFGSFGENFPDDKLSLICSVYPNLDKSRLKTELSVIYARNDCRELNGALPLLKFLIKNNLQETLTETKKLLEILVTIPMTTAEAERCFSTLKRVKTFLRNTMSQDRLTALSMLSIEKKFVSQIKNFNDKVIDKFAAKKERRIDLVYKL